MKAGEPKKGTVPRARRTTVRLRLVASRALGHYAPRVASSA